MSEKKFLPDVTRRDVLKGIAKGAAASQAPISGLSSLVKGVKTGLDINQKLDLTKNIIQGLLSLERQFDYGDEHKYNGISYAISVLKNIQRQEEINPYPEDSPNHLKEEQSKQRRKERFFPNEEPNIKEIINFIQTEGGYAEPTATKITKNDIVRILDLIKKQNKLLDTAKKYDLPLQYMLNQTGEDHPILDVQNYQQSKYNIERNFVKYFEEPFEFLESILRNFDNKLRPKFLEEYNTPNEEIESGYIGSHGGKFRQRELYNKLQKEMINKYGEEEGMYAGLKDGQMLTTKVDYNDPLVKEYKKAGTSIVGEELGMYGGDLLDDPQAQYELMLDSKLNDGEIVDTQADSEKVNWLTDVAGDLFKDYAGKKLQEVLKKRPNEQVKRLSEPEAIDVEVQNKKEIPIQAEQEAPVPPGSLGKILKRVPYVGGFLTAFTPTQMGDAELKIKDQQGNLIQKRKGGTVMKNYYKNYNTQRTI